MDLARAVAFFVDGGNLYLEQKPHRRAASGGKSFADRLLGVALEMEQAGLGGNKLLLQLGTPHRVRKVAGCDDADAFSRCPVGEMLEIEIAAGRARIFRMDVQIRVKAHRSRACVSGRADGVGGAPETIRQIYAAMRSSL